MLRKLVISAYLTNPESTPENSCSFHCKKTEFHFRTEFRTIKFKKTKPKNDTHTPIFI